MVCKKDISLMSADELSAYVEKVRAKRRERAKHYYDNVIKNDPEKYAKFLRKLIKHITIKMNKNFFSKNIYRI
jgi:hypothetical protein